MTLSPGSLVALTGRPDTTYQVVNVDEFSDRVWVRRWPLTSRRSPTFSMAAGQVEPIPTRSCA